MSVFDAAYEDAGMHANYAGFGVQFGMANVRVIANLITGGVCHRFPDLKFVSVESGIGWIPFALDHLDWQWHNCGVPQEHPEYDLLPSEYFVRQMYGCFWFETDTVQAAAEQFGSDWILYESDFPHPTCMAPGPATAATTPRSYIAGSLGGLPGRRPRKTCSTTTPPSSTTSIEGPIDMRIGVSVYNVRAADLVELAVAADQAGFSSLWLGEHLVLPCE